jgi:hypothetical protein
METGDNNIMNISVAKPPLQVSLGSNGFEHQTEENVK